MPATETGTGGIKSGLNQRIKKSQLNSFKKLKKNCVAYENVKQNYKSKVELTAIKTTLFKQTKRQPYLV